MERLYTATVNMDTHPEKLACLFRELGQLELTDELGNSHSQVRSLQSLLMPVSRYVTSALHSLTHTTVSIVSPHGCPLLLPLVRATDDEAHIKSRGEHCDSNITYSCHWMDDREGEMIDDHKGNGIIKRKWTSFSEESSSQVTSEYFSILMVVIKFIYSRGQSRMQNVSNAAFEVRLQPRKTQRPPRTTA